LPPGKADCAPAKWPGPVVPDLIRDLPAEGREFPERAGTSLLL